MAKFARTSNARARTKSQCGTHRYERRAVAASADGGARDAGQVRIAAEIVAAAERAVAEIKAMKDHGYNTEFAVGVTAVWLYLESTKS